MNLLSNIRKIREDRGLRQKDVADFLGMSTSTYSEIEAGNIRLTMQDFLAICKFLNIDPILVVNETQNIIITLSPEEASSIMKISSQIKDKTLIQNVNIHTGDVSIGEKAIVNIGNGNINKK